MIYQGGELLIVTTSLLATICLLRARQNGRVKNWQGTKSDEVQIVSQKNV
jgi:hypothetical protein